MKKMKKERNAVVRDTGLVSASGDPPQSLEDLRSKRWSVENDRSGPESTYVMVDRTSDITDAGAAARKLSIGA
jgi:hypothetical protein